MLECYLRGQAELNSLLWWHRYHFFLFVVFLLESRFVFLQGIAAAAVLLPVDN